MQLLPWNYAWLGAVTQQQLLRNCLFRGRCQPIGLHAAISMFWRGLDHHPSARGTDEVMRLRLTANDWQFLMWLSWTAFTVILPCTSGMKRSVFWNITACSPLVVNRRFWRNISTRSKTSEARKRHGTERKQRLMILKMEATCSSETSVDFHRTTLSYIPEERTLQNLTSYNRACLFLSPYECVSLIPWLTPCNNVKWSVHSKHITHATRSGCIWYSVDGMLGSWVQSLLGEFVWDILCWGKRLAFWRVYVYFAVAGSQIR
jgi:hypothetical protein